MNFIGEETIDLVLENFSGDEDFFKDELSAFAENQAFILSFLMSEGFNVLEKEEKSLMLYLSLIIFKSVQEENKEIPLIDESLIANCDERNWTALEEKKLKSFGNIADYFFEGYDQEDLLAFVEDSLMEDEESQISEIGRKVIFVSMKTLIDSFHEVIE